MSTVPDALRVLLVDDEELVLRASGRMLAKKGLLVAPFSSPVAAIAAFTRNPADFDAALIDLACDEPEEGNKAKPEKDDKKAEEKP